MSDALKSVRRQRWIPGIAWVIGVLVVLAAILCRNRAPSPPAPAATRDLPANHLLAAGDLSVPASAVLVGQYLRRAVSQGDEIAPRMVSRQPFPASLPNTVAVVVTIPDDVRLKRGIEVGSSVWIVHGSEALAGPGTVLALARAGANCSLVVGLETAPGRGVNQAALAEADVQSVPPLQAYSGI